MIEFAIDFLIDLFFFLFPISFVSRQMGLKNKKVSDLKPALENLGFKKIAIKSFAKQTIVLFAVLVVTAVALSALFSFFQVNDLANVAEGIGAIATFSPLLLAYFLIVRIFTEEVFFRGFLVNKVGVIPSTAVFALLHAFYFSYAEVAGAFVLGLILALWFKKNQNLIPVIVAHMLYNFFALAFILGGI
tara:strand:- start:168 stop:734 length:567 start_codon:yes stop_codon:yes gene_type:complete